MNQHTKPPAQSEVDRRRAAACHSMWCEHALVRAYCAVHGPGPFSLRNLITFALAMDQAAFDATQGEGAR